MHRVQQGKAHQGGAEHAQHLAHVGAQQELDGLADVIVDAAAFLHCAHDGGKVVVRQHHVRHVLGNVGAGDAHAHADICALDGGCVVDAVAGHSGNGAVGLPRIDDAHLMLRLHTGVDPVAAHCLLHLLIGDGVQFCAGNGLGGVLDDAQFPGNGHSGILVVTGDHHRTDAGGTALGDRRLDLRTHRVDHTHQAHKAQLLLQLLRLIGSRLFIPDPLGGGQHTQSLVCHALVLCQDLRPLFLGHGQRLAVGPILGAALQHLVRGALGILDKAVLGGVDGGHHLTAGVKGGLVHTGGSCGQLGLGQPLGSRKVHQCGLGGLAFCLAVLAQVCVVAQGQGGSQALGVAQVLHHGHLILGQGAGLIRADHLGAAQGLHSGQAADHCIALAHIGNADGQHHRHHRSQALGDSGNCQGHRHHKGGQHALQREGTSHHQVKDKDEHADAQHQLRQGLAQLIQTALQGGLLIGRIGQRTGDLAHLGVHTSAGDQGTAAAIHHGGAHIAHILAVAQGHFVLAVGQAQRLDDLVDRHALAGKGSLLDLEAGALQQAAVCRDAVAGFQHHHITGHQLVAVHGLLLAVPQHLAGGGGHGLQRFDGRFGLALLQNTQHGVQQHHDQDNEHLGKAFPCQVVGHSRDGGSHHQDHQHGVLQLCQEPLHHGGLFGILELIGAVFFQPGRCFCGAEALFRGLQLAQQLFWGLSVLLLHFLPSFHSHTPSDPALPGRACRKNKKRLMHDPLTGDLCTSLILPKAGSGLSFWDEPG